MCGRYVLDATPAQLVATFHAIDRLGVFEPRFNAAPGQLLPVVVQSADGTRVLERALWGLAPPPGVEPARTLVNARAEALGHTAMHRDAFLHGRCIVPATGFYEWAPPGTGPAVEHAADPEAPGRSHSEELPRLFDPGPVVSEQARPRKPRGAKVPVIFQMAAGGLFGLAGIARQLVDEHGEVHRTFAIVTTTPNDVVRDVHDRMPAILPPVAVQTWLEGTPGDARNVLGPYPAAAMDGYAVATLVNDVANDGPELLIRAGSAPNAGVSHPPSV